MSLHSHRPFPPDVTVASTSLHDVITSDVTEDHPVTTMASKDASSMESSKIHYVRTAVDVASLLASILLLLVLRQSDIRGSHSYVILVHSSMADMLMAGLSLVLTSLFYLGVWSPWELDVMMRLECLFGLASLLLDLVLVANIYLAVSMGLDYKVKVNRKHIEIGVACSWIMGVAFACFAFVTAYLQFRKMIGEESVMYGILIIGVPVLLLTFISCFALFLAISINVKRNPTYQNGSLAALMQARLEFVKVLRVAVTVRLASFLIPLAINAAFRGGLKTNTFVIGFLFIMAYCPCKVIVYLILKKPLRKVVNVVVQRAFFRKVAPVGTIIVQPHNESAV